jgi:hypothetical protein
MKKIIVFIILVLSITSCKKFLDEVPKDQLTENNFYKSLEDAVSANNAIYSPIRDNLNDNYSVMLDILSDNWEGRGSTMPMSAWQGLDATNITRVSNSWGYLYRGIRNANIAIQRTQEMTKIDQSAKDALVAEARFLRAYIYYTMVRLWGPVPLYLQPELKDMSRRSEDEIYTAIIEDLQAGETALPSTPSQFGHPTKWSAKALLAEVYLTRELFSLSRDKANEVIQSGQFALVEVSVSDDFNKVFGPNASGTKEEIFYLKFNHVDGYGYPHKLLWDKDQFSPFGSYVTFGLTTNLFLKNWDNNDLRKKYDIFSQYINRFTGALETLPASTPILCSKYRDPGATSVNGFGNDRPVLRFADVLLIYAEASVMADNSVSTTALECLNKIKRRAYGFPSGAVSTVDYPSTGWSVDSFRNTVIQERGYELFMEGKRFFDLKRLGTARLKELVLANKGKVVKDLHLLWPIPLQELNNNPSITQQDQNPGY